MQEPVIAKIISKCALRFASFNISQTKITVGTTFYKMLKNVTSSPNSFQHFLA